MAADKQKLKLLYLIQLLYEETDQKHGVSLAQIIEYLAERDIQVERKSIYRDIDVLNKFGMQVEKLPTAPPTYAYCNRPLSKSALLLLVDAVQSTRFLTQDRANKLVDSIKKLGSSHQVKGISKHVHVAGRIKSQNESVFLSVDVIQRAISERKRITFKYFSYDVRKQRVARRDGKVYEENPVRLLFADGFYYLVVFSDKYQNLTHYRVDRMQEVAVSESNATKNAVISTFNPQEYEARLFGMFSGNEAIARLLVEESCMNAIVDKFGEEVQSSVAGEGVARVTVRVTTSDPFFAWLAQFGSGVVLEGPSDLKAKYVGFLKKQLALYQ